MGLLRFSAGPTAVAQPRTLISLKRETFHLSSLQRRRVTPVIPFPRLKLPELWLRLCFNLIQLPTTDSSMRRSYLLCGVDLYKYVSTSYLKLILSFYLLKNSDSYCYGYVESLLL